MPTERWTVAEEKQLDRFFRGAINTITLAAIIQQINPDRTYDAIMGKIRREKRNGRLLRKETVTKQLRVGYLDIETSDLPADFGFMISYYIKARGKNQYYHAIIDENDVGHETNWRFDKALTEQFLKDIENFDVLYAHYGADGKFDIPFLRTRVIEHGLTDLWPNRMEKFILDTYPLARQKLRLNSYRLNVIGGSVGAKVHKTPLLPKIWKLAAHGQPEALSYVDLHNKRDVQLLEQVHRKLERFETPIYRSM